MKTTARALTAAGLTAILLFSWIAIFRIRPEEIDIEGIQGELFAQAMEFIHDGIYIRAVPYLEEAASYETGQIWAVEEELKKTYLELSGQRDYLRRYLNLLDAQIMREDVEIGVFIEYFDFLILQDRYSDALDTIKKGIAKTNDGELIEIYENNRYRYKQERFTYDNVGEHLGGTISVMRNGLWGIARANGSLFIPCIYDKVTSFNENLAIAKKDGEIFAIDEYNNRISLLKTAGTDFGNYASGMMPLMTDRGWQYTRWDFSKHINVYEEAGTFTGNVAPVKLGGKWGVIDASIEWLLEPVFDDIIMDGAGRIIGQGAFFGKIGSGVHLYILGQASGLVFDDARPFKEEGYAAVKQSGKWGFINEQGELMIDYIFDDALSFGQHLAPVKEGDLWGYVSLRGEIVIMPEFLEAKPFSMGSAPVLTEHGWTFITLLE